MKLIRNAVVSAIGLALTSSVAMAGYEGALSGAEVEALLSGNTYQGKHSVKGFEVELYVDPAGTVVEKRGSKKYQGKWHVDREGRFCWVLEAPGQRWSGSLWCRWVIKTGDNEYIKVRDSGKEVRRFKVIEGKAF